MQTSIEVWNNATREQLQTILEGKKAQAWLFEHDLGIYQEKANDAMVAVRHTEATLKMLRAEIEVIDALLAKCEEVEECPEEVKDVISHNG